MLLALGMMAAAVGCSASQEEQQNQNNSSVQEDTQTEETNTEETDAAAPVVTIKLAKQRAGSTGKVNMIFRKVYSEFVNIIRR